MGQKKLVRKAQPPSKRGIAWPRWTGFRNKTVWDFLQLLIVPLMLAAIGFWFTGQQDARQQQIENQRAQAERELAEQRAQDEALQAYLDQMGSLLLERDLRTSKEDSEVRTLARARTLTMLGRLDPNHKTAAMQFLVEADLVQRVDGRDPIISLRDAELREADLSLADLRGANLRNAELSNADLNGAVLGNAELGDANLSNADLLAANLNNADLGRALMSGAYLFLANLRYADPTKANLHSANLSKANLSDANLNDANLHGAVLNGANLSEAEKWTEEQLSKAKSLEGATMPNGQRYEDWLKSKGRGRMGRTNMPRSIGPRIASRGKRKAGLLWEGEDSECTRLDDCSDCSTEAGRSTYAKRRIFVCQVAAFVGSGPRQRDGPRSKGMR